MKNLLALSLLPLLAFNAAGQDDTPGLAATPGVPEAVEAEDFQALRENSPFTRSLNLSDSLILTGIAQIGSRTVATILDKESKETYVVSEDANPQGWRMVEIEGDQTNLEKITAKIAVAGGEVVSVRFDEERLKPGEARPAAGPAGQGQVRGGDRGRGPSEGDRRRFSEIREKMSQLSDDQRRKLFEKMGKLRERNPDMTRDQMREHFQESLNEMTGNDRR